MARKTNRVSVASPRAPRKAKQVSGNANKLKKLAELKQVNKDIENRFKISEKLFEKKEKLMNQLGINRNI